MTWWLTLAGRLFIGALFIWAAYSKLRNPWMLFAMAVDSYQMLPIWAVEFVARTLPWAELVLGAMLIFGIWVRWAAVGTSAMLAVFVTGVVRAYAKGLEINCGCFSNNEPLTKFTIVRDATLLAISLAVAVMAFLAHRRARHSS